jgi:hypothetical protein
VGSTCFSSCYDKDSAITCLTSTPLETEVDVDDSRNQQLWRPTKHGGVRDYKFLVTHPMTYQRCLTSTIAPRSALTTGPSSSSITNYLIRKHCLFFSKTRSKLVCMFFVCDRRIAAYRRPCSRRALRAYGRAAGRRRRRRNCRARCGCGVARWAHACGCRCCRVTPRDTPTLHVTPSWPSGSCCHSISTYTR